MVLCAQYVQIMQYISQELLSEDHRPAIAKFLERVVKAVERHYRSVTRENDDQIKV